MHVFIVSKYCHLLLKEWLKSMYAVYNEVTDNMSVFYIEFYWIQDTC